MKDFSRESLIKTTLLRPISTRSESSRHIPQILNSTLSIRRITPVSSRITAHEFKGTQTIDSECTARLIRKRIILPIFADENEESPSIMISNEIFREYLKKTPRLVLKERTSTGSSIRISSKSRTTSKLFEKSKTKTSKKQEIPDNKQPIKPQRMFDYKEIFSIANNKMKFR